MGRGHNRPAGHERPARPDTRHRPEGTAPPWRRPSRCPQPGGPAESVSGERTIAQLQKEPDPEPTATTAPTGMLGVMGTLLLVVLLLPSWPKSFSPQARMPPLLVRASTCRPPATAEVTVVVPRWTRTGW